MHNPVKDRRVKASADRRTMLVIAGIAVLCLVAGLVFFFQNNVRIVEIEGPSISSGQQIPEHISEIREDETLLAPLPEADAEALIAESVDQAEEDIPPAGLSGSGSLMVSITDEDNQPLADIWVSVIPGRYFDLKKTPEFKRGLTARTDESGVAEFENLKAGYFSIMASASMIDHEGPRGLTIRSGTEIAETESRDVALIVYPEIRITGRTIDADTGEPIEGISLNSVPDASEISRVLDPGGWDTSDTDGNFSLLVRGVRTSIYRIGYKNTDRVLVTRDRRFGFGPQGTFLFGDLDGYARDGMILEFKSTVQVSGRAIVKETSDPAPGANIKYELGNNIARRSTVTDGDGKFTINVLPDSRIGILAFGQMGWGRESVVSGEQDPEDEVIIELIPSNAITGIVKIGNEPQSLIRVLIQETRSAENPEQPALYFSSATTDENGIYYADNVPGGTYNVRINEYDNTQLSLTTPHTVQIHSADIADNIDFILSDKEYFDGFVLDEDGNPIADASISQTINNRGYVGNRSEIMTDLNGYFRILGVTEETKLSRVTASADGYDSKTHRNLTIFDSPLDFVLKKERDVILKVVDSTGFPVTRFRYLIHPDPFDGISGIIRRGKTFDVEDEQGETSLKDVGSNAVRIEVAEINNGGSATGRRSSIRISPNADGSDGPFVVNIDESYSLTGMVINNATEEPIKGATVVFLGDNDSRPGKSVQERTFSDKLAPFDPGRARTDSHGVFRFDNITDGYYAISAFKDKNVAMERLEFNVGPEESDLLDPEARVLRMVSFGSIEGTVKMNGDVDYSELVVQYSNMAYVDFVTIQVGDDGTFLIESIEEGTYELTLRSMRTNEPMSTKEVIVGGSEPATIAFDFTDLVKVIYTVSDKEDGYKITSTGNDLIPVDRPGVLTSTGRTEDHRIFTMTAPGLNLVKVSWGSNGGGIIEEVMIPPTPQEQEMSFAGDFLRATVEIILPEGHTAPIDGTLTMTQIYDGKEYEIFPSFGSSTTRMIERLAEGTWVASFETRNALLRGVSEPFEVTADDEIIIVEAGYSDSERGQVAFFQYVLTLLGYDPGPVDGYTGPMTSAAIREFERDQDLPVTGQVNQSTMGALERSAAP